MKAYGITYPNGTPEVFAGNEAAGLARIAFAIARGALNDGESVALWSVSETGFRSTLESVYQPHITAELPN